MTSPRRILVVEDDPDISSLVRLHLVDAGYEVELDADGRSGLDRALGHAFDLVILDIMLPGVDGLEICRRLRAEKPELPILMLTARTTELDRVLGLEMGADDYLTKPFSVREIVARVKAIFRRIDVFDTQPEPAKLTLAGYEQRQLNRVFPEAAEVGYAVLTTSTPGGAFFAYGSVVDNKTADPTFIAIQ